ncbi:MAG TPA: hypothetical protein VE907_07085 [Gammaproteobacteria bacterium]|nr:hypothetical protein [Gammaproteobacteria bacterium]
MVSQPKPKHPWRLVGPWYRWPRAGVPSDGRSAPPAIQKFSSDDFVNEFIKEPQRSLKFDDDVDRVYAVQYEPATLSTGPLKDKLVTLFPQDANGKPNPSRTKLVSTQVRKLFLPTHSRHYLVVCELHCDMPGLPSVRRAETCQAGFVVRRKHLSYPESARPFAVNQIREIVGLQARLAELDESSPLRPRAAKRRQQRIAKMKDDGTFVARRAELVTALGDARRTLEQWKTDNGVRSIHQGWVPGEHERIGAWQIVEDEPQTLTEAVYPLFPLVADPNAPEHDAAGRTMFFGLIPASSFDTDAGKSRYDDESIYEIRCFVRRHDERCPRKVDAVPDCCGELVWSLASERYQLAAQFDVEGTANRPITIKMPNLAALAALAAKRPFGKFSPVKVIQPQSLKPKTDGTSLSGGAMGGVEICFFSIPLITIVAMFVLNIFLPIVVLVFGLWFLLAFKFCIPPSIAVDAGIQAELDAVGAAGVDIDTGFSLAVDFQGPNLTTAQVNADLSAQVSADIAVTHQLPAGDVSAGIDDLANSPLSDLNAINVETASLPSDAANDPPIVDLSAGLEYEDHRVVGEGAAA